MDYDRLLYIILGVLAVAGLILIVNNDAGQSFGMDNSKFVSLVMLGSIGVAIGMNLMTRGGFTGNGLRIAAVWVCLFLALMVAYQLLAQYDMLPENFRQPNVAPQSGTGVSASLMDRIDGRLHL